MSENSIENRLSRIEQLLIISTKEVLNTREAALLLGISEGRLLHLTSAREIPHYKNGTRNYFRKSELEQAMLGQRIPTNQEISNAAAAYCAAR